MDIDQEEDIKRYYTSKISSFLEETSMFEDSITERKIGDHHVRTNSYPDNLNTMVTVYNQTLTYSHPDKNQSLMSATT